MKKLVLAALLTVSAFAGAETFYYGEPAVISGKLMKIKSLHPNQKDFGGNQIAVTLNSTVNVDGDEGLVKTKLIQLVDGDSARYQMLFKKHGSAVRVKCSELFRAHTAHHTTKVLCFVDSVSFR